MQFLYNMDKSYTKFNFNNINPDKLSVSFTWDDNFERHINYIAPVFAKYKKRCTFYVNPGEQNFKGNLQAGYAMLAHNGFEIGSHGYTHHHFSRLPRADYLYQLSESKQEIMHLLGVIPTTFAFPHHDFTPTMLKEARRVYFETRNTLNHTPRFSLKSHTSLSEVQNVIENAVLKGHSLVFSGHSVCTNLEEKEGYEPIPLNLLDDAIRIILKYHEKAEICTFRQAVIKEYIFVNCRYTMQSFYITKEQLEYLETFGLTTEKIEELV